MTTTNKPEHRVFVPALRQDWLDVSLVHWPVDVSAVRPVLPKGLEPDVFDGSAWLSYLFFRIGRAGGAAGPMLDALGSFPETNLRTYAIAPDGRAGMVLLAVEAANPVVVNGGRVLFGTPYRHARMSVERRGDVYEYRSARTTAPGVRHEARVVPSGTAVEPRDERSQWLLGRWHSWSVVAGVLGTTPAEHEPWRVAPARLESLDETITREVGVPAPPPDPPVVQFSPGLQAARLGVWRPVRLAPRRPSRR